MPVWMEILVNVIGYGGFIAIATFHKSSDRSINNTDRSALIELERLVAWSALSVIRSKFTAAANPNSCAPSGACCTAIPAIHSRRSPLHALAQPDPMDRHSGWVRREAISSGAEGK